MSKKCSGNDSQAVEVRKAIQEGSELCGQFNFSDLFWFCKNLDLQGLGKRLKRVRDKYDEILKKIIQKHQEIRKQSNLLMVNLPRIFLTFYLIYQKKKALSSN